MSSPQPAADPQAEQAGLAIALSSALLLLWPQLDLGNLRDSLPAFKAAVAQEVRRHAMASATLAVRQYRRERAAAGIRGGFTPVPTDPPTVEQIAQSVDWATQPLWNADVVTHAAAGGTTDVATPPEAPTAPEAPADVPVPDGEPDAAPEGASTAIADAKARLAAATEQQVLDAGRDTIVENVQRDKKAKAWARIAEPNACSFCAMLATRGAVYHAKRGEFKAHDHCQCHVEPVFTAYEPSAKVREWQALYKKIVTDEGRTGDDARMAFRQAIEGRPVTGKSGPKSDNSKATKPRLKPGERGPEQVRAELSALEKNLPNLKTDQQREWTRSRMAALRKQLGE